MNHGTAGTVYVVDDDESMRRGLRRLFRSVGYSVVTFSLAEEFLLVERTETAACTRGVRCLSDGADSGLQRGGEPTWVERS